MNFTFFSPVNIIFGPGISKNILDYIPAPTDIDNNKASVEKSISSDRHRSALIRGGNKKAFLIRGKDSDRADKIIRYLEQSEVHCEVMIQTGEPSVQEIIHGVEMARKTGSNLVVAIGGGSVIDTGKAVAALTTNKDNIMSYLEVIGLGKPLGSKPLPMIAIPTTSGTGAEVTCNAVISSYEHKVKVSLRSQLMYPDIAVIDPELCLSMPPHITASTGMDALTQLVESFTSKFANPITDSLCREGIAKISKSFKTAYDEPSNIEARSDMSLAAMLSGITLANAKLGAVHGIAGPMGGMTNKPHGVICARLLGEVMTANIAVIEDQIHKKKGENDVQELNHLLSSMSKYQEIARILTGNPFAAPNDAISYINEIVQYMKIRDIEFPEPDAKQIEMLARQSEHSSSMKGNPVILKYDHIRTIIEREFSD